MSPFFSQPTRSLARTPERRSKGASLIEVLIALLVLSVGLLAMAGIQASSFKLTHVNKHRLTATVVAQGFAEAVKANSMANSTASSPPGSAYGMATAGGALTTPGNLCTNVANACTPAQIAAVDLFEYRRYARGLLPSGDMFVQFNAATAATSNSTPTLTVWVYWRNPRTTANAAVASALETTCPQNLQTLSAENVCVDFMVSL